MTENDKSRPTGNIAQFLGMAAGKAPAEANGEKRADEPPPKTALWHPIALAVRDARAQSSGRERNQRIHRIAVANGISFGYAELMHSALKGWEIGAQHGIGHRLSQASHVISEALGKWPEADLASGIACATRFLDGKITRVAFLEAAASARARGNIPAEAGGSAATEDAEGDDEDGTPAGGGASAGEVPDDDAAAADDERASKEALDREVEAALARRRIERRDARAAAVLADADDKVAIATRAWPDERIGEATALVRAVGSRDLTAEEIITASEVQKRIAEAEAIIAERNEAKQAEADLLANRALIDPLFGSDYYAWSALRRIIDNYKGTPGLAIEPHRSEPNEFAMTAPECKVTQVILIRPERAAKDYALDRWRALHRVALEGFADRKNINSFVAMPPEADPAAFLAAAREKGIDTLWVLTMTRAYSYNHSWERAVAPAKED